MFTNISWKEYSIFILTIVFIYYTVLLIVFYKREISHILNNLNLINKGSNFIGEYPPLENSKDELHYDNTETPAIIKRLQKEIKTQLEGAKIKKPVREEIIMSLQMVLQNYNSIKQSEYKDSINIYIKETSENLCSIHLDEKEIDQLWFR